MRTTPAASGRDVLSDWAALGDEGQRDEGLRRVSTLTRWTAAASAIAAALFTLVAAHPKLPKLPKLPTLRHAQTVDPGSADSSTGDGLGSQGGFNGPAQAPVPASAPAQVVSGSS